MPDNDPVGPDEFARLFENRLTKEELLEARLASLEHHAASLQAQIDSVIANVGLRQSDEPSLQTRLYKLKSVVRHIGGIVSVVVASVPAGFAYLVADRWLGLWPWASMIIALIVWGAVDARAWKALGND